MIVEMILLSLGSPCPRCGGKVCWNQFYDGDGAKQEELYCLHCGARPTRPAPGFPKHGGGRPASVEH